MKGVFGIELVESLCGQIELPDTVVDFVLPKILITRGESISGGKLIVDAGSKIRARAGIWDCTSKLNGVEIGVERGSVDNGNLVNVAAIQIKKEGCLFVDRAANVAAIEDGVVGGLCGFSDERVPRVKCRGIAVDHELAVQLVSAWLGEDFNAAIAELVVFCGKRVLIQADFADRRFRRQLAGGKAVDVNLSAVRSSRWAGKSGEFFL